MSRTPMISNAVGLFFLPNFLFFFFAGMVISSKKLILHTEPEPPTKKRRRGREQRERVGCGGWFANRGLGPKKKIKNRALQQRSRIIPHKNHQHSIRSKGTRNTKRSLGNSLHHQNRRLWSILGFFFFFLI